MMSLKAIKASHVFLFPLDPSSKDKITLSASLSHVKFLHREKKKKHKNWLLKLKKYLGLY